MPLDVDLSVLPPPQRALWPELNAIPRNFVLYGGTAVALRLAHRVSVDFDFFSSSRFDPFELQRALGTLGTGRVLQSGPDTLTLGIKRDGEIKLSCFGGIGGRVGEPDETADGVLRVASPLDLLAHKLKVILQRAEGRDYQDIVALLRTGLPLGAGLGAAATLFPPGFPVTESAKALTYFGDIAEPERLTSADRELLVSSVGELRNDIPEIPLASALSG